MQNIILKIKDIHCTNCVMRIEGLEDDLPGIKQISASYKKQQVAVQFDENLVGEKQIISALEELGYHLKD
jgi:copper chaperone CopZ